MRLVVRVPDRPPEEIALNRDRFLIGRSAECNVFIDDGQVSRTHAVILREGKSWVIEDLDSRNGTFVNDVAVDRRPLRPGDVIRLGESIHIQLRDEERRSTGRAESSASWLGWLQHVEWLLVPQTAAGPAGTLVARARVTTVGREDPAHVVIEDDSISRVHARIDRRSDGLVLTDLKSSNGTFVNGERIIRGQAGEGDVVRFGERAYVLRRRSRFAWSRLGIVVGGVALIGVAVLGIFSLSDQLSQRAAVEETRKRIETQAMASIEKGIAAHRRGQVDYARSYLLYAADVLTLADLAPSGATRPADVLESVARSLPAADRDFDFEQALDPTAVRISRLRLDELSDRDYVEYEIRRLAIELGQDEDIPDGFVDQVWRFVQDFARHRDWMRRVMGRAETMHDRLEDMMVSAHLPAVFTYVAWVESGLNPTATSSVGARGLWQFMVPTARQYGLKVDRSRGIDERTDVNKSTRAATRYIGNLIRKFGREQFMCALASYNRGEGAVWRAMEKIPDPMMPSSRKYWYLVEQKLLPRETSEYVPKIFAARIVAEDPERFGFASR